LYDAIVVGGGLIGNYVACKLAGMGYKVVVLERHEQLGGQVCCTGIISQECLRAFAVNKGIILRQVNSARLFSPSGNEIRLWREEIQASIISRSAFDCSVAGQARNKGAEYWLGCLVTDVEYIEDGITVKAIYRREKINLPARAVVIATGFNPKFTERLRLGRIDDFAVSTQAEVEVRGVDEIEVYFGQEIAPGFFGWLVPTSDRRALVGLLTQCHPEFYLKRLLLNLISQGKVVSADVEPVYGGIPLKSLPRTYGDRLLVVGDAAGQVKPTTGGGIYFGLLSAEIAADVLHRGLTNGALSARNLARYERGWKQKLEKELAIDYYARKFYQHLGDQQIDKVFAVIKSHDIDKALSQARDLSFDWHGRAVLRLMRYRAVAKLLDVMKMPFRPGDS